MDARHCVRLVREGRDLVVATMLRGKVSGGRRTSSPLTIDGEENPHAAFLCCGVRVDALSLEAAIGRLRTYAECGNGRAVHLCNAYTLALASRDPVYTAALNRGDMNLADGTPLAWLGRRVGFSEMRRRVYGPDLTLEMADKGRAWGIRHYFYGSTNEVIHALRMRLNTQFPGLQIVGAEAAPLRSLNRSEELSLIRRIRDAKPHIVWIGLGTPRQDWFVDRFRERLDVTLVPVGAAFDFIAGTKRQAPKWMQERGLEWVFRLGTEPRRLWRRYLLGNFVFMAGVSRGITIVRPPDKP